MKLNNINVCPECGEELRPIIIPQRTVIQTIVMMVTAGVITALIMGCIKKDK